MLLDSSCLALLLLSSYPVLLLYSQCVFFFYSRCCDKKSCGNRNETPSDPVIIDRWVFKFCASLALVLTNKARVTLFQTDKICMINGFAYWFLTSGPHYSKLRKQTVEKRQIYESQSTCEQISIRCLRERIVLWWTGARLKGTKSTFFTWLN